MKISDSFLRTFAGTLGLCLLSAGCIINGDDGGNASNGTDSGNPPTTSASGTVGTVDDTTSGNPTDTGTDACEGAENLVSDPGFEEGSAGTAWTAASVVFETPICDSSCTDEEGAAPYAGDWWVWFGGLDDEAEMASVEQAITIPTGDTAQLTFRFQIRSGAGTGDDVFLVEMVDADLVDTLWTVTDADMPSYAGGYHRVDVDVTPWADGGTYTLRFSGSIQGSGLTSFFLDEVSVTSCSYTLSLTTLFR